MRRILFLTFAFGMQMTVIGQKKKQVPPPPPPPIEKSLKYPRVEKLAGSPSSNSEKTMSVYERLLNTDKHPPLAFRWTIQQDTLLLPNQIFSKHIEIDLYEATLNYSITNDSVTLKKEEIYHPLSHKAEYIFFNVSLHKDIVTLIDKKTEKVTKFKLFLNPEKNDIIKIQDLKSKEIYQPTAFEGPTISM